MLKQANYYSRLIFQVCLFVPNEYSSLAFHNDKHPQCAAQCNVILQSFSKPSSQCAHH